MKIVAYNPNGFLYIEDNNGYLISQQIIASMSTIMNTYGMLPKYYNHDECKIALNLK